MEQRSTVVRFGLFEFDIASGELYKQGRTIRLGDQPRHILTLLLERPGEVVSREAVRHRLWPEDTFVDFDAGLNSAVKKLRNALGDPADNSQFIETLPRRGYRFIAPVKGAPIEPPAEQTLEQGARWHPRVRAAWAVAALFVAATAGLVLVERAPWALRAAGAPRGARDVSPQAHDAYLKGTVAMGRETPEGFRSAVAYFEEAIAREPDFAQAYVMLAQAQMQFLFTGPLAPRDVVPKAEAAARRALQLDDTLPQAHTTLGAILMNFHWKWEDGQREFERARQLRGRSADTSGSSIGVPNLIRSGDLRKAVEEAERASQQDPRSFSAHVNAASAYRAAGQHDRAVARLRRALEIDPKSTRGQFQLGLTLVGMGRLDEGIVALERAVTDSRRNARFVAYLGYAYGAAGRRADALAILEELESRSREQYVSSFGIALIYDALGQTEPALVALERAHQEHAVEFAQMNQYPPFKTIATEPRYQSVMRSIGLPRR
jgi:DNA-binding winged helix-turn-helix (wHTH) protein/Tfp pilus assembly protein PilF